MKMIVAVDEKFGIGIDGGLLTDLPEDMKFFKDKTMNSVVILGRKTLLSFPGGKPLKNRVNIIITRDKSFKAEGCIIVHSVEEAAELAKRDYAHKEIFVIGGGSVYRQMLKYCSTAYITKIYKTFEEADTFIDNLDKLPQWVVEYESDLKEHNDIKFKFVTYKRTD